MSAGLALAPMAAALAVGCHAGAARDPPAPGGGFTIAERAEAGPITALAVKPPFLWAAGGRGLRRFDVTDRRVRDRRRAQRPAHARDHRDRDRRRGRPGWRARPGSDAGSPPATTCATSRRARRAPVTVLAARRPIATEGLWLGGPGGLYRYDGRIFPSIDGMREVPVSSSRSTTTARAPGSARHKHGLYHAEGDHAAPVPGGEAIFVDAVLGIAKTADGHAAGRGQRRRRSAPLRADDGRRRGFSRHRRPGRGRVGRARRRRAADRGPAGQAAGVHAAPAGAGRGGAGRQPAVRVAGEGARRRWAAVPTRRRCRRTSSRRRRPANDLFVAGIAPWASRGSRRRAPLRAPGRSWSATRSGSSSRAPRASRCYVVTDGPRAWLTDGDSYQPTRLGEPEAATPLALASDAQGTTFAIARDAESNGLVITRLPRRPAGARRDRLAAAAQGRARAAAQDHADRCRSRPSRAGTRCGSACASTGEDGNDSGYGAVEIDLGNGHAVQHRPRRANEKVPAEALPLPTSLTGILFDKRRDLLRVAVRRQPLAGRAAPHLERERRPRQRVGARDRARQRRRDLGGDVAGARPLRRPELAAARGDRPGHARPRHRRQGPDLGRDRQGAAGAAARTRRATDADPAPPR